MKHQASFLAPTQSVLNNLAQRLADANKHSVPTVTTSRNGKKRHVFLKQTTSPKPAQPISGSIKTDHNGQQSPISSSKGTSSSQNHTASLNINNSYTEEKERYCYG